MFNVSKIRKSAAPIKAQEAQPDAPQVAPQQEAKPSPGSAPTSGWVDLKKAHKDIGDLLKNPAGKEVEVKSTSKAGVHTFTITVKPTEMMARAEQNGGVQQPQQPQAEAAQAPAAATQAPAQTEPEPAMASKNGVVRIASAATMLNNYPKDFLKTIGL